MILKKVNLLLQKPYLRGKDEMKPEILLIVREDDSKNEGTAFNYCKRSEEIRSFNFVREDDSKNEGTAFNYCKDQMK